MATLTSIKDYFNAYISDLNNTLMFNDQTDSATNILKNALNLQREYNYLDNAAEIINGLDPRENNKAQCAEIYNLLNKARSAHYSFEDGYGILIDKKKDMLYSKNRYSLWYLGGEGLDQLAEAQNGIDYLASSGVFGKNMPLGDGFAHKVSSECRETVSEIWQQGLSELLNERLKENQDTLYKIERAIQTGKRADEAIYDFQQSEVITYENITAVIDNVDEALKNFEDADKAQYWGIKSIGFLEKSQEDSNGLDYAKIRDFTESVDSIKKNMEEMYKGYMESVKNNNEILYTRGGTLKKNLDDAVFIRDVLFAKDRTPARKNGDDGRIAKALFESAKRNNGTSGISKAEQMEPEFPGYRYDDERVAPDTMITDWWISNSFQEGYWKAEKQLEKYNEYQEALRNNEIIEGTPDNIDVYGSYDVFDDGIMLSIENPGDVYNNDFKEMSFVSGKDDMEVEAWRMNIKMLYDKDTYDGIVTKLDQDNEYREWLDAQKDLKSCEPRYGRGWDYNGVYIEGKSNGCFEHEDIDNAFAPDGKLTPEAQDKITQFVCHRFDECPEYIAIMDDRDATKLLSLDRETVAQIRSEKPKDQIAEKLYKNVFEYADYEAETLQDFINGEPHADIEEVAADIERLHDRVSVYHSIESGMLDFLGSHEAPPEIKSTAQSILDLIHEAEDKDARLKDGFSMYFDTEPLTSEEKLDLAVSNIINFKHRYEDRYEDSDYGLAETSSIVKDLSQKIEDAKDSLGKDNLCGDRQKRQKIRDATKIQEEYTKWFRMDIDWRAEHACACYNCSLPWGETGLHVKGLPDTISTQKQRDAIRCNLENLKYNFGTNLKAEKQVVHEARF